VFLRDERCRWEIDHLVGMLEYAQLQNVSDDLEGPQSKKFGQLFDHNMILHEKSPAGLSRIQQASGGQLGGPGWWLWRPA